MAEIQLGDRVKDQITGLTGIVTCIADYLYNCRRITVAPERLDKDGNPVKDAYFDEGQLSLVKAGVVTYKPSKPQLAPTGGPSRNLPTRTGI